MKVKKTKRFLSLLLLLVIVISGVPLSGISVFAGTSGDYTYEVLKDGTAEITDFFNLETKYITVPSEVDGYKVSRIGDHAFSEEQLAGITLPNTVTSIGYFAFGDCVYLTDIKIPDSVTTIESYAFTNCRSLKNITLPNGIKNIGGHTFSWSGLTSINIPDSVVEIGLMAFRGCASLTNVTIPNSVTTISHSAFMECNNLINVTISDSVEIIDDFAFGDCTSLKSIVIPDSVVNIGNSALGYFTRIADDGVNFVSEKIPGFKIYGYKSTAAETYANENGFEFIALNEVTDKDTGISVSSKENDAIPDGAQLKAEKLASEKDKVVFDISLVKDGVKVQPNGEVTVKIPVPEGMDSSVLKVYREETDGNFTDMNAYYTNGYMVFTTDHFSKYVLTAEEIQPSETESSPTETETHPSETETGAANTETPENPETGSSSLAGAAVLGMIAATAVVVLRKKKEN